MPATIYLIDGSAYIYRAYHAIKSLGNSRGLPTNAVFGFVNILNKLLKERDPQYLAIAFDTRGPVFRHEIYPDYKANRPPMPEDLQPQIPYIHAVVQGYNILNLTASDQEADDLIASAVTAFTARGHEVVIVSGDKDLLQLVSQQVTLWDPMNDRLMDEQAVEKKYGVAPAQLLDYFALTGDSADNIPGVPGVGPKTAQKLIEAYGSVDGLYAHVHELKPSKTTGRIIENREQAYLSRRLVQLNTAAKVSCELEHYARSEPDHECLRKLYTELEFHSLLKKETAPQALDTESFFLVQEEQELEVVCELLADSDLIVLDTETDSLDTEKARLVGISLCIDETAAWYIPCGHVDDNNVLLPGQLETETVISRLRPLVEDKGKTLIGHNIKFDYLVLSAAQNGGLQPGGKLYDTMIGAWLLDPGKRSYKLDELCAELDLRLTSFAEVVQGDKRPDAFCRVALEEAKNYSCEDVYGAWQLYMQQHQTLDEWALLPLMEEVEGPTVKVLAAMEHRGIKVDLALLKTLAVEFAGELEAIEEHIYAAAGEPFNIQSPKQLGTILFEKLNLPKGKKTKTGWSTDVRVLEKLAGQHELPALVLQYRNLAKLKSTYVDKLAELCDPATKRVHTSYNQCGTATGRLSSSNPNLQNIPIRTEEGRRIRAAFIAEPGWGLLSGDYSQIDLRVMAHYSKDEALLASFGHNEDVHRQTASQLFYVTPALVTNEMRRVAKTINFGIVYGMSSFGLSSQLNISRKEAQTFIDRYFAHYKGVKEFMQAIVEQARQDGYVTTLTGRRRMLPDIHSKNRNRREFAERIAVNTPIQGTAADIMKVAMLKVDEALRISRLQAGMMLQIHDELVLEVPEEDRQEVSELLRWNMETAVRLDVPLLVNLNYGRNLAK